MAPEPIDTIPEDDQAAPATIDRNSSRRGDRQSLFGTGSSIVPEPPAPAESEKDDNVPNPVESTVQDIGAESIPTVDEPIVEFRVCAGNLMSASPWFNRVLTKDGWMESNTSADDRLFHVSAEDWDEEAFFILMNVFHLRNHSIPRKITLEMLAKIAILVDYYECSESVDMFIDIWVADLRKTSPVPTTYCRDLILWMWISWNFKLSDLFREVTTVAIQKAVEPVRNLGLPIPAWVTHEIDLRRHRVIDSIRAGLNAQLATYRSARYICPVNTSYSFQCGSMLFGALTKQMDSAQLSSLRPTNTFLGLSFDALCFEVRLIKSSLWWHDHYHQHDCNVSTAVNSIVDSAVAGVSGLGLRKELASWQSLMRQIHWGSVAPTHDISTRNKIASQ
ncbi:hypothetical protein C7974DRAFT_315095 [Boeremia exigua]|uniref:uncharacterized protein n=1 Tax=Boeremia exigua TaxID=749465 RepID=UPI001E8D268A|nr:uncharacterized protein C7974DRAFT_315095 [Boeremia exigua]KAH6622467.1 hypothetical protein C7974DRAFT_315095 [Boeremia exigua]